jgi:hypothetical protein
LFTAIRTTAAYYPTRTENGTRSALARLHGNQRLRPHRVRRGEIQKVRRLLPALGFAAYAALDISRDQLLLQVPAWRWTIPGCR